MLMYLLNIGLKQFDLHFLQAEQILKFLELIKFEGKQVPSTKLN